MRQAGGFIDRAVLLLLIALAFAMAALALVALALLPIDPVLPSAAAIAASTGLAIWAVIARRGSSRAAAIAPRGQPIASSPLALEELRGEVERYRALEKQLTQAKQQAEAAAMAKSEFLATMSHEIRTPLNGIVPILDLLRDTRLDAEQSELLGSVQQSAKQLMAIVDDILDYSKIEANKLELETVDLDPVQIVEQVARMMAPVAAAKGLRLQTEIEPAARVRLRGDPVRLRQVLTNLVSNAIKFTETGSVAVELKRSAESRRRVELQFAVKDTGIGISATAQQRLFQSFSQADASTTRLHGGTGLGLAICRRLIELMEGQIGVRSEPGRGSVFWFRVRLAKGDAAGQKRVELDGLRAMIVSPEPMFVRRMERQLSLLGLTVMTHAGGPDLLASLRGAATMGQNWLVDFLLLDAAALGMQAQAIASMVLKDKALGATAVVRVGGDAARRTALVDPRLRAITDGIGERALRDILLRLLDSDDEPLRPAPTSAAGAAPVWVSEVQVTKDASVARNAAPLKQPGAATGHPASAAASAPAASNGAKLLLVEDNPVNRLLAEKLLRLDGYQVETAVNGQLAVEALQRARFDLVIMDCQMPVLDGYQATRRIRQMQKQGLIQPQLPIVAMTANAMLGDREKCLAAGMDDYLTKPLDRALLRQRVSHHLQRVPGAGSAALASGQSAVAAVTPPPKRSELRAEAVDQEVLRELIEVMGHALTDLVKLYLEDAPALIAKLRQAALREDVEGMAGPAHSLKSASANLGAIKLSDYTRLIEHGARLKTLSPPLLPIVEQVEREFALVALELKLLLDQPA